MQQSEAPIAAEKLAKAWKERWYEFDHHGHVDCCFAGELPWTSRPCERRHQSRRKVSNGETEVEVIDLWDSYSWESNVLDCSIEDSIAASLVAKNIVESEGLIMSCDGPSWSTPQGELVAAYREDPSNRDGYAFSLFVKAAWLDGFLSRNPDWNLVLLTRYERLLLDSHRTREHPRESGWFSAVYRPQSRDVYACYELIDRDERGND